MSSTPLALLELKTDKGRIFSPVRQKFLEETPEERVRQTFLLALVNDYGYTLEQIAEEMDLTGRGAGQARADFVIWRTPEDKIAQNTPLIIVECKSDNVSIKPEDYRQGDNYARIALAPFVITHNSSETRFWRVMKEKMPGYLQEIGAVPKAGDSDKEIEQISSKLKVFKEDDFAKLLGNCHNIIRNRDHLDPAAAFDEIAKILFIKVFVERYQRQQRNRQNLFTTEMLKQVYFNDLNFLFTQIKTHYQGAKIFGDDEKIHLKSETGRAIVEALEVYNLSDTSEDIKGIAFERFLGRTFRGEIGQFFTPRVIVEFMIRFLEPTPDDVICDPASGSGGFLIRFFELVREQILAHADAKYQSFKAAVEADTALDEKTRAKKLRDEFSAGQNALKTRLKRLAEKQVFGTDANDRMARTSKMNMIMHGDGHAGVHHNNGFLNVNGIFEGRFSLILTNPPFGSSVEETDRVTAPDLSLAQEQDYINEHGEPYRIALQRLRDHAAKGDDGNSIAKLFTLGRGTKIKTEILFIERCLELLKPGGRLGIVLPEGIFNNPSLDYVREWCEDRAWIRAVISLPSETFVSSGASVKTSLLFMQKFTAKEKDDYETRLAGVREEVRLEHAARVELAEEEFLMRILTARKNKDAAERKIAEAELKAFKRAEAARQEVQTRATHKERWAYPVFLYEGERVGITATGEEDCSELLPPGAGNPRGLPPGVEQSCLDLYRQFRADPEAFFAAEDEWDDDDETELIEDELLEAEAEIEMESVQ